MTTTPHPTVYTQQIAAAFSKALKEHQLLAKVGLRQPEGLLYIALEPVGADAENNVIADITTLLTFLNKTLGRLKGELALKWVKLVKVSGRLADQNQPLWQKDLLPFSGSPQIAETLAQSTEAAAGDVSISIGGDMSAPLIVGNGNQLHNYAYNVEHGGVLNIAAPPTISPRATPIALKPKPFANLLDRQTVLPILRENLTQQQPVEVYAAPGFGKTTLMRHVAHWPEIVDSFVDGVVYLPVARQLAEDLLQSLYDVFYEAAPSFKPSYGQIQQALKEKQSLIILNGLGLEKEEMEWLMAALPNCTFLLVSKERLYWQEGADIALTGLPLEDAIALLQQDLNRPLSATEKTAAATLHQSLSGNPLQIRRAAAQIKSNNETLDRWIDLAQAQQRKAAAANAGVSESDLKKSSLNRAVFTTANKKLSPAQKRVLALLGAMGGVALSSEQAQAISKMPEAANALNELASLQLIESTEMGYQLCGDLGEAVSQTFDLRPWLQQATDYFVGAPTGGSSANTEAMLHLLEWTQQTGQWQQSLTLAQNLDSSLAMSGQWQQWQQVLTHSLQAAQQVGNGPAEAWALHQLGTSAIALGNHTQAETWLSRAVTLREALKDFPGAAVSRHNLGLLVPPLIAGQGFVPAPSSSSPSGSFGGGVGKFVGIGALVGTLLISGTGIALWLGSQSTGSQSADDEVVISPNDSPTELEDFPPVEPNEPTSLSGLTFDSGTLSFGNVLIGQSARKSVNVTNSGESVLTLLALSTTTPEEFSIVGKTCADREIAPNESCTLTVLFEPRAEGDRNSTLIVGNSTQSDTTLPLIGIGIDQIATDPLSTPTDTASTLTLEDQTSNEDENLSSTRASETPSADSDEESAEEEASTIEESDSETTDAASSESVGPAEDPSEQPEEELSDEETAESEAANQPPVVQDVDLQLTQGEPYTFNLLQFSEAYDPDPDDSIEVLEIGAIKEGGVLENNGDGTATYYPYSEIEPGQFGIYQNNFEFTVVDSQGEKAYGTVFITVTVPEPTE